MIKCLRCQTENPPSARFCMQCGQALVRLSAATEQPSGDSASLQGENRVVTVLFIDIAGSTRLAGALGAEPWHLLLNEFFAVLTDVVERQGGTVNQYTGDGLMALFGAPVALEDHALRACSAALDCQQRLQALADRVRLEHGLSFGARAGINTGPVVIGTLVDGSRQEFTAQGPTVHLAARMEQIAPPGGVMLTENSARLVDGYMRLRTIGPTQVKGLDAPVDVFELQGAGEMQQRLDRSRQRGLSPLVGRTALRKQLDQAWDSIRNDAGSQVWVFEAEAGIGKSRLCLETLENWQAQSTTPVHFLRCAAVSHGESQPLAPIRAMLSEWLGVAPGTPAEAARRIVAGTVALEHPRLQSAMPVLLDFLDIAADGKGPSLPPDARQRQLAELPDLLCSEMCDCPVLLWIDDWHWLDQSTISHLQSLLPHLMRQSQAMVLVTTRPTTLPDWMAALTTSRIPLQPLSADDMGELLGSLIGTGFTDHPLQQQLLKRSEGNPYFIEEAVAHLVDNGILRGRKGHYQLTRPDADWEFPNTVQALLEARLDRISGSQRVTIDHAALIGREFSRDWLMALLETHPSALDSDLNSLADARFLIPPEDGPNWRFAHGLLQETVWRRQLEGRRREGLRRLAEVLVGAIEGGEEPESLWARVGDYRARAGDPLGSAAAYIQGAQALGRTQSGAGLHAARLALKQTDAAPDSPERDELRFHVHTALLRGSTLLDVDATELMNWRAEAAQYLEEHPDPQGWVEFWMSTGTYALNAGHARPAYRQMRQAVSIAQKIDDPELLGRFRVPVLFAHLVRGAIRRGLEVLDASGQSWRKGPVHMDTFMSRGFRTLLLATADRIDEAVEELEAVIAFTEAAQVPISWMYANHAEMQLQQGRLENARVSAERAVETARSFGSPAFDELATRALAQVLYAEGQADAALELLETTSDVVAPGRPGAPFAVAHGEWLARLYAATGNTAKAATLINQSLRLARERGQLYWLGRCFLLRAKLDPRAITAPADHNWARRIAHVTGAALLLRECESCSDP